MMLTVENLCIKYGDKLILNHVSFSVAKGEIVAIKGANGTGKSTLCGALCQIAGNYGAKVTGSIRIDGEEISSLSAADRCTGIGMIFQNPDTFLFSPSVEDELAFGPENLCLPRNEIERRIDGALEATGIQHLRKSRIQELSGGEKQLVAIASVLTMKSKFIAADEITSRIDKEGSKKIRNLLKQLKENGTGIVLISHNPDDIEIADRYYTLECGHLL